MRSRRVRLLPPFAAIVLATACTETTVAPPAETAPTQITALGSASPAPADPSARHLVLLRGNRSAGPVAALVRDAGGELVASLDQVGIVVATGLDDAALALVRSHRDVEAVESDEVVRLVAPVGAPRVAEAPAGVAGPDDPSAAFLYARQWHLQAIGAETAWAAGHLGSPDVTVAILDTGIAYTHPDLAGRVDLTRSASFVPEDDELVGALFPGAHPVADLHLHGTHVAATVASNGFSAAGVTSGVTLIGVKVCDRNGDCSPSNVLAGILHAADEGADVINLSLEGAFLKAPTRGFHSIVQRVTNYAHRKGSLIVAAAGNQAFDMDHIANAYFTYCSSSNVLCVSATGPEASGGVEGPWSDVDVPAPYTNFGRSTIDVAAPGGALGGAVWGACSPFSIQVPICGTGTFVLGLAGTSMAAPHVSGLAALLVGVHGRGRPAIIRNRIRQSADDLGQPGHDPFFGAGRVNIVTALGL